MQLLAAATLAVLFGASILVGVRLLLLHRRTRGLPELLLGSWLLLVTGFGYPFRIAAYQTNSGWASTLTIFSDIAIAVGFSLLFVFTWRVFRPQSIWAKVFVIGGLITETVVTYRTCVETYHGGSIEVTQMSPALILLRVGPFFAAYAWAGWESFHYHSMMRRRVGVGLADPAVADRFRLFALMSVVAVFGMVLNAWLAALHVDTQSSAPILFVSSLSGLAQAIFLVLAFLPPRFYLSWVRARAAAGSGA